MQVDFPNSPNLYQVFTSTESGKSWVWDGEKWLSYTDTASNPFLVPTGAILPYASSTAPTGWLPCDGRELFISEYPGLYGIISTTYNTSGGLSAPASGKFRIPPLSGRVPVGIGGATFSALGVSGGAEAVTLTGAQSGTSEHQHSNTLSQNIVPSSSHTHIAGDQMKVPIGAVSGDPGLLGVEATAVSTSGPSSLVSYTLQATALSQVSRIFNHHTKVYGSTAGPSGTQTVAISNASSTAANASAAHTNLQPYIVLNYIIKT